MEASRFTLVAISALLATTLPSAAATIHVPDDQPTIQAGIDAASAGDTVLVACGTYYEHDILVKSGICLMSETGTADCVTIDAQQQGRVFLCDLVDNTTHMSGFTITGGSDVLGAGMVCYESDPVLSNVVFSGNVSDGDGGGMYCDNSAPTLTNVTFSRNTAASRGGGMSCDTYSSPTLMNVTFSDNVVKGPPG